MTQLIIRLSASSRQQVQQHQDRNNVFTAQRRTRPCERTNVRLPVNASHRPAGLTLTTHETNRMFHVQRKGERVCGDDLWSFRLESELLKLKQNLTGFYKVITAVKLIFPEINVLNLKKM